VLFCMVDFLFVARWFYPNCQAQIAEGHTKRHKPQDTEQYSQFGCIGKNIRTQICMGYLYVLFEKSTVQIIDDSIFRANYNINQIFQGILHMVHRI